MNVQMCATSDTVQGNVLLCLSLLLMVGCNIFVTVVDSFVTNPFQFHQPCLMMGIRVSTTKVICLYHMEGYNTALPPPIWEICIFSASWRPLHFLLLAVPIQMTSSSTLPCTINVYEQVLGTRRMVDTLTRRNHAHQCHQLKKEKPESFSNCDWLWP